METDDYLQEAAEIKTQAMNRRNQKIVRDMLRNL